MSETENIAVTRKRLLWRAHHRGIKEMDLVFGGFADQNLDQMDQADLDIFAALLDLPDQEVLAWMTNQESLPQKHDCAMLQALLTFRPMSFS